jgi:DNA-binding Lrp family transcriptional regulator
MRSRRARLRRDYRLGRIEVELLADAERSNAAVASQLAVHSRDVRRVRRELEGLGVIDTRTEELHERVG